MHRCPRHLRVPPHNLNADRGAEECGGCIMLEVLFLVRSRLDVLDVLAESLRAHAELRTRLAEVEGRLMFYEPGRKEVRS